jgi:hypothetical protein
VFISVDKEIRLHQPLASNVRLFCFRSFLFQYYSYVMLVFARLRLEQDSLLNPECVQGPALEAQFELFLETGFIKAHVVVSSVI